MKYLVLVLGAFGGPHTQREAQQQYLSELLLQFGTSLLCFILQLLHYT
jgi:hypothetical protein